MATDPPHTDQQTLVGRTRPTPILYVDDEPALLALARLFLERQGLFSVETAESAAAALEKCAAAPYDAVVSDYQMPGMNGIELLKALRRAGDTTPFIIFTGKGREEVVIEAFDSGADFYVQKGGNPAVQFAELVHKIRQAIRRRTAEAALRESEERCRALLRNASDIITVVDPDGTIIYDTGSPKRILGYPEDHDVLGRSAFEFMHPADRAAVKAELEAIARNEPSSVPTEFRVRKADGSYIRAEAVGANCLQMPGVHGLIVTIRPIEERKRAEAELRSSDRRFREVFDGTDHPYSIHEAGPDWAPRRFVDVNDAACRLLGYGREELLGRSPGEIDTGELDPPPGKVAEMLETAGCATFRTRLRRRDGALVRVELRAHAFELDGQRVVLSIFEEIARRSREERLLHAQRALVTGLQNARELPEALEACLSTAIEVSGLDAGGIYLVDPATGSLDLAASRSLGEPFIAAVSHYPADSANVRMVMEGRPFLVPPLREEQVSEEVRAREGLRAVYVVPILSDGAVIACLNVASRVQDEIAPEARTALETISAYVGEALVRLRAESALRESEERFKAIFAGQQNGILIIDPSEHRIVDANPYLCDLVGLPRAAITGHVCHTFVCPAELGSCPITDLHQRVDNSERVLVAAGGRKVPVLKTVSRVRFGDREYLVENIQDITERKEAERALKESEEKYRALFAAESDGIFVIEKGTGTILDCNEAVTRMYGYARDELVGLPSAVLAAEPETAPAFPQDSASGVPVLRHLRKDGAVFQVEIAASGISLEGRDVIVAAVRDISDRRRVEEALATANRKLNLMSSVTRHDISNQISVIRGYLELLGADRAEPWLDEYLRPIAAATERMEGTIQFTRTYETIGVQAPIWQDLAALVEAAVRGGPARQVAVERALPAGVEIFADPLVEQVVFNLLDNAVRHGGALTRVRFSAETRGRSLVLVCENDGTPIPATEKERIFERGYGRNTGLGLFLAREILGITGIAIRETGKAGVRFEIAVPPDGVRHQGESVEPSARALS